MQALGRDLEIHALETEIRGIELEIQVLGDSTDRPIALKRDGLQAGLADLQIQLSEIRGDDDQSA